MIGSMIQIMSANSSSMRLNVTTAATSMTKVTTTEIARPFQLKAMAEDRIAKAFDDTA